MFPTPSIGNFQLAACPAALDKSPVEKDLKTVVEERLEELGRNPFEAARLGDLERGFINDILQGKKRSIRGENMRKLAVGLDWTPGDLLMATSTETAHLARLKTVGREAQVVPRFLLVRYRVQAGHWYEVGFDEPPVDFSIPVVPDPRYAEWPQWAELVVGPSANKKIPEGHFAHVVDAIEMGYEPKDGDWVIVERRRSGGHVRERTIKQLEVNDGVVRLWPRSTDQRFQEPVDYRNGAQDGEDVEVEIVGKVIGSYNPEF